MAPEVERSSDPDEQALVPGYRNYLIFCDDSGLHGSTHYGFGSLWMPSQRRGDIHVRVRELRDRHRLQLDEIKWNRINARNRPFYEDLVEEFFTRPWLMFHCLVVRKGYVDKEFHDGDYDLARRKHFAMLLKQKIGFFSGGAADKAYHVRVDRLPSRYEKADEVAFKVVNASLAKDFGVKAVSSLFTRDSKASLGIQLADLLLGAVMAEVIGEENSAPKLRIRKVVADHLGWTDLKADTILNEWKFNIWHFHNPRSGEPREVSTRTVRLKVPMPELRRP
jgi:Protein of unknown function (DUF3800)